MPRDTRLYHRGIVDFELPESLWKAVARYGGAGPFPPTDTAGADRFVRAAAEERLFPLLCAREAPYPEIATALERARAWRHAFSRRAAALDGAVLRVGEMLKDEPFLLLKGSDYRFRLYPETWLRPMQDVDVLVPAGSVDAVTEKLEALGLPRTFPAGAVGRLASHHERIFRIGDVTLEVHQSFIQQVRYRIDYEGVWARRARLSAGPLAAERLGDADALVYHAISFAIDEFAVTLIRFLDFWLLLRRSPEVMAEAVERARAWRAERALYGALQQTSRVFPEFDTEPLRRARERLLPPPSRWFLDRAVLPRAEERLSSKLSRARQLWRKFWLLPGFPRRAAFFLYHAYALAQGSRLARKAGRVPT
ncbi:MAG TPA: nucleotidyltransferase family protein [Thermoanaerobaculia bacterium]|nr:nucleotidyltransferase family protein [Thermoanaerobaculia bacterium]